MFWVSEDLGLAVEFSEGGFRKFNKSTNDFDKPMTFEEIERFLSSSRKVVSAAHAADFASFKASSEAS